MVSTGKGRVHQWIYVFVCLLILAKTQGYDVGITYVQSAVAKGGVCLDGSPPAYHMAPGFGAGINNWIILLEGGAWCDSVESCLARKNTRLGSSKEMVKIMSFSGVFSNKPKTNPDFYDWNKIKVRYCDGSSYTGDIEAVNPATNLHFRGARVFQAIIDDLLAKGMKNAKNAILHGCSAGGTGAILNCDKFKSRLPASTKVKCLSDAGYFVNAKAINGVSHIESFFNNVVTTHGSAKNLPQSCTSRLKPGLCFFPQNVIQGIKTPIFLINSGIDSWQIKNIVAPGVADRKGTWRDCKADIMKCSAAQLKIIEAHRQEFVKALSGVSSSSNGYYINSCYAHCQSGMQETWLRADSPLLDNKTIAKAVGDWYFDRSPFKKIDCPFPCDKTCHNRVFDNDAQPNSIDD